MDSFNIDMELLRRIGLIRRSVEQIDGDDPQSLGAFHQALAQVRERSGSEASPLNKLLSALEWGMESAPPEERSATSRLATGILAAVGAAEQALFSDGAEGSSLLDQAGSTFFLALGRDPGEWASWSPDADGGDDATTVVETDAAFEAIGEKDGEEPAGAPAFSDGGPTLDDLAAFQVRMDPEDRGDALRLREMVGALLTASPDRVRPLLEEMDAVLDGVTTPPRTRKPARQAAVEKVGELLEEAILLQEEGEGSHVVEEPVFSTSAEIDDGRSSGVADEALSHAMDDTDEDAGEPDHGGDTGGVEGIADDDPAEALVDDEEPTDDDLSAPLGSSPPPALDLPETEPLPGGMDRDLVRDFLAEGSEYLEQAEDALLALEADPRNKEAVNVVFRAFHTIKGVSGFLELHRISDLAHHAETLLSKVRDDELRYSGIVADLSLRGIDVLKALLSSVHSALEDGVLRLPPTFGPLFGILANPELPAQIEAGKVAGLRGSPSARIEMEEEESEGEAGPEDAEAEGGKTSSVTGNSVRVRTDRLDRLVDMVGELVIAHSMLAQDPLILRDRGNLSRTVDHSQKILRELQDLSTSLRMVPLKPAFRKVTRTVRDLSKRIGKPVHLVTEGEDTEIDRTMVDILADPLVHMVRNSLDHGLETPEERVALGKPRDGRIRISAYQAGGNVVIEVSDDGRGLDREKILAKARERGVVDSDRGMTDQEVFNLIFAPGFSTADKVTDVSGRGVGMDVVRRNVESLRGRVSIDSRPGRGSTFSIHLPLTLAITDGMVIRVGTQRFIIPSVKIHMSLRPEASTLSTVTGRGEMVLLQGDLLPIIRLHRLWGIAGAVTHPTEGILVVVGEGGHRSALLVDDLVTQQQFVVKPLSGVVANTQGVAGGAIMGNGDVGLILDPEGIIAMARGIAHSAAA